MITIKIPKTIPNYIILQRGYSPIILFIINNCKKIKFSIKDLFSKFIQFSVDSVTFTEEIFNGKLHFFVQQMLWSVL